jgi:hypothetical protein
MKRIYDLTKRNKSIEFALEKEFTQKEFNKYRSSLRPDSEISIFPSIWSENEIYNNPRITRQTTSKNYLLLERIKESIYPYSKDNTITDQQKFFTYIKEKNIKPLHEKFVSEAFKLTKKFKNSLLNNQQHLICLSNELEASLNESDSRKFLSTCSDFNVTIIKPEKIKTFNKFFYFFNKSTKCNEFIFLEKIKNLVNKYEVDIQAEKKCFIQTNIK